MPCSDKDAPSFVDAFVHMVHGWCVCTTSAIMLSVRLVQQRDEFKAERARIEGAFEAERRELREEIDRLKNKGGWFRFGGKKSASPSQNTGGAGERKGGATPERNVKVLI